jgi:hypothetical protein
MSEHPPHQENDDERRRANLALLVFFVVIVGIGVWLVNALVDARNADNCIAQRRTNCTPIETPPR